MRRSCTYLVLLGLGLSFSVARADDWPQWRGPDRNGISKETGLLKQWPKDGPPLVWRITDIDYGYSTPSIVGDRLYLLSNKGLKDEYVLALDARTGKEIWKERIGNVGPNQQMNFPAARSTPTVVGEVLYALGSDGDLACLETESGKVRWAKNLRGAFEGKPGSWAYSESVLIDGDALVCTPGGPQATMVALNRQNGELIWKCLVPGHDKAAYASAIIVEFGGIKQYVQLVHGGLIGVEAATGKFLWRYDQTAKGSPANMPTPVHHNGMIYCAGARTGAGAVKLELKDGQVTAKPAYFSPKLPVAIGGSVVIGDYLYGTSTVLMCVEFATGNIKWSERSVGTGSICYADGFLYIHGESGELALVEATPDGYQQKGRFKLTELPKRKFGGMEKAWSYPIIANGKLYIRDLNVLWCFDIRETKAAR